MFGGILTAGIKFSPKLESHPPSPAIDKAAAINFSA